MLLSVLSLQFALTTVGEKAGIPSDRGLARTQGDAFHLLALFEHGAADVGGGTALLLLATSTLLTCTILLRIRTWRLAAITAKPLPRAAKAGYRLSRLASLKLAVSATG